MQVAGKTCEVCQTRIFSILDGRGCIKCDRAYHADCLADGVQCPHCMSNLDLQAREHEAEQRSLREDAMRHGRKHFIISMILATLPMFVVAVYVSMFSDAEPMARARSLVGFMGWCAMWVWVWRGSSAARIIAGLLVFASVVLFASLAFGSFTAGEMTLSLGHFLAALSLLFAGLLVFLRRSISTYLDSHSETSDS